MRVENGSRSSRLFLMELMIAILFFSLGSAVCIQAFAKAHATGLKARELSFASSSVSSAANVIRYAEGTPEGFLDYYPEAFLQGEEIVLCYDEAFAPCGEEQADYVLRVRTSEQGIARSVHIWMENTAGELIYELNLRYPGEAGEARS